ITNVANFGAFVDIGVHQDGLVHISALSNEFIKDPRDVVKAGQIVKVKVLEVDKPRKRISLTMRLEDKPTASQAKPAHTKVKAVHKSKPIEQTGSLGLALQAAFNKPNKVK
ncbi:MAG TPA: S1 RNA-binding domain-containing protein, partial [Candidatus Berkiella sp.]|nr:S1 RNA-binding domain-containing protein [Candidatus Berkiella sp.]